MKLYYAPGSCAMAVHITANEAGVPLEVEKVDLRSKQTAAGSDFRKVNPNGYVPAIVTDQGDVLTEAIVLMQYVADRAPASGLLPPAGSLERYQAEAMLAFLSSEIHKTYSPFFNPATPEEMKVILRDKLVQRLTWLDRVLQGSAWLTGDSFSPADAYLWVMLRWSKATAVEVADFPNLARFADAVAARPAVQKTLKDEGLA